MPAPKKPLNSFGWEICKFCEANLVTNEQIAKVAGISKSYLSELMRGYYTGSEEVRLKIADAMFRLRKEHVRNMK